MIGIFLTVVALSHNEWYNKPVTDESGGHVRIICRIDRSLYSCVANEIITDEVVLTEKSEQHIFVNHPENMQLDVIDVLAESVQNPDYILKDPDPRIAIILKSFLAYGKYYRVILKLATADDTAHPKNSILTAFYISEKKWEKYAHSKKVLYKRMGQ